MSDTPRTDAEHAKTLTPAYEYVGAEWEAWEWARKLERELAELKRSIGHAEKREYSVGELSSLNDN
jgi:hypothetical protein